MCRVVLFLKYGLVLKADLRNGTNKNSNFEVPFSFGETDGMLNTHKRVKTVS